VKIIGKKFTRVIVFYSLTFFFLALNLYANNVTISNVSLTAPSVSAETIKVEFDLSWDNSWRNQANYDTIWIFVKYSTDSGTTWNHATLSASGTNPAGSSGGSGTSVSIIVPTDKKGAFIQRSAEGQGTVTLTDVQLVWAWGVDGLSDSDSARVHVVGLEMVYIPEGAFYLGDGNGSNEAAYAFHLNGSDNNDVEITTMAKTITCDTNANDDIDTSPISIDGDGGIAGNSDFPTGYQAFYIMKYEISENQWIDFFNTLSNAQKLNRDITGAAGKNSDGIINRNTVGWIVGNATTTRGDRTCAYLSWMDLLSYADWAGLRPMTELEYEKAARGTLAAVYGEYAWGDSSITAATTISGTENGTETITNSDANSCYNNQTFSGGDGSTGPVRNGIFATSNSTRTQAGAGYYGTMEMSGNVQERVVSVGTAAGRLFTGTHGDGIITTTVTYEGNATNTDWPGIDGVPARGVTGSAGSGIKGGGWSTATASLLQISDRTSSSTADSTRGSSYGGRCVRTAP